MSAPVLAPVPEVAALAAEPWALEPSRLERLFSALLAITPDAVTRERSARAASPASPEPVEQPYTNYGGVAQIDVRGVILGEVPEWFAWFGIEATSTRDLRAALDAAIADPAVRAVLFVVDSPGGVLSGLNELGDAIYSARSLKPSVAACDDIAASAAYWIASQAGRVTASKTTEVGSIGVYRVLRDWSRLYEDAGIKTHVISSGPHKGVGVAGAPVGEGQLAVEQEQIDQIASIFRATVARGRDLELSAVEPLATGRVWIAAEAQRLGLIDAVSSVNQSFVDLKAEVSSPSRNIRMSTSQVETPEQAPQVAGPTPEQERIAALERQLAEASAARASELEAAQRRAEEMAARVAALEDERLQAEYMARAAQLPHVAGLAQGDLATVLRCAEHGKPLPSETAAKLVTAFASINAIVAKSALLREVGTLARTEGSPADQLQAAADAERAKDPGLTQAQAYVLAMERNPQLYVQTQKR